MARLPNRAVLGRSFGARSLQEGSSTYGEYPTVGNFNLGFRTVLDTRRSIPTKLEPGNP